MLDQQYIAEPLSRMPDDASTMAILRALVRNPLEAIPEGAYRAGCVATPLFGRDLVYVAHPNLVRRVLTNPTPSARATSCGAPSGRCWAMEC